MALIELGGGYRHTDLNSYFGGLGQNTSRVSAVGVNGGSNSPGTDADAEVMLDIEVCAAIVPGVEVVVYFSDSSDRGFLDAVSTAVHDPIHKPSVISIS